MKATMQPHQPWVLHWQDAATAGPALVGGKGWNLGRLARYGFPVPAGGVVIAQAYERFMAEPALETLQNDVLTITAANAMHRNSVQRLETIQAAIVRTPFPKEISAEIRKFLVDHHFTAVP